jgi:hypothetical protein
LTSTPANSRGESRLGLWSKNPYGTSQWLCQIVERIVAALEQPSVSPAIDGSQQRAGTSRMRVSPEGCFLPSPPPYPSGYSGLAMNIRRLT